MLLVAKAGYLRNPAKLVPKHQSEPRTPFLPVATSVAKAMEVKSHRAFWRRRVNRWHGKLFQES